MYDKGWNQFIPFVVTVTAIVFTDLLIGIMIGMAVSIFFILRSNYKNPFTLEHQKHVNETIRIDLSNQVSFLNKASIKDTLWSIPEGSKVIIDASSSEYIDHDIQELIMDFKNVTAPEKKITLNVIGLKNQYIWTDHVQFVNVIDKETQELMTPAEVIEILKAGNERFVNGKSINTKYFHQQIDATAGQQHPMAVVLGCIDSRTSPELIFDAGLGDILSTRIAGNIVSPEVIGSLELACDKIGTKLILIKGHSNCGAVSSAINNLTHDNIGYVTAKIRPAVHAMSKMANGSRQEYEKAVTIQNIQNSVNEILQGSELISDMVRKGKVGIVAAYYDTETGEVSFYHNMVLSRPIAA
jgi:carbonic anhydrase